MPPALSFSSVRWGEWEENMIQEGIIGLRPINMVEIDSMIWLEESVQMSKWNKI